jgi:hypothetical protein
MAVPEQACTAVYGYDTGYATSVQNMSQVTLNSDGVFGDGWDAELATVTGDSASGMTIALTIGVGEKSASTPPPGGHRTEARHRTGARPAHAHRAECVGPPPLRVARIGGTRSP